MKAFLITSAIFVGFIMSLALATFLILVDTSPMGKMEYLFQLGKLNLYRYTGVGNLSDPEIRLIYEGSCTGKCHSRDVVERSAHNVREWEEIVGRMRTANKANVTSHEARVITTYLTKRYGSNIPTILTLEGGKYLKKYLWRSDFGESDLYVDVIYTPMQYFNFIGGSSVVEGYDAGKYMLFKVYINTHQNKLAPYPIEKLAILKTSDGKEARLALWKVIYESADYHHREGMLAFERIEDGPASISISLMDLPGQKERIFQWDLPIPEKQETVSPQSRGGAEK